IPDPKPLIPAGEAFMRTSRLLLLIGAALALTVSPLAAQQTPQPLLAPPSSRRTDQFKRDVGMEVDAMGENIQKMNDMVFSFAELGFQEFETTRSEERRVGKECRSRWSP